MAPVDEEFTMTNSLELYMETILRLIQEKNAAHVSEIAERIGVKQPSVIRAMTELKALGLIAQKVRAPVTLTAKGRRLGAQILLRHDLLKSFLQKLGVAEKHAETDATAIGHSLSADALDCIGRFVSRTKGKTPSRKDK